MSDTPFLHRILLACSRGPVRLFRCNRGIGWTGKIERPTRATQVLVSPGDIVIRKARALHAGLADGNGDLIGWRTVTITPDMVGDEVALFVSLEAKEGTGRLSAEQKNWRDQVQAAGGIATEVRSVEDAERALGFGSSQKPLASSQECCGNRITRG